MKKLKRHRMPLSAFFPATHPRKGERTYFNEKLRNAINDKGVATNYPQVIINRYDNDGRRLLDIVIDEKKLHTIRENYEYWEKRIDEVNAGDAVLEVYEWTGKPFRSKCRILFTFDKASRIGVQEVFIRNYIIEGVIIRTHKFDGSISDKAISYELLAKNDGLSLQDFKDWFAKSDLSKPKAIIHFTSYRY